MEDEEDRFEKARREWSNIDNPRNWLGVQIGQRWYSKNPDRKGFVPTMPHYVVDLLNVNGERRVTVRNGTGTNPRTYPLHEFLMAFEHR